MTIREALLQAVRSWLKLAAGLTDAQVIVADDKGPRPALPYLTVKVTSHDLPVGEDEERSTLGYAVTVLGGVEDDSYTITVNDTDCSYTRLADDTDADVAAALAAAVVATVDDVLAVPDGATFTVGPIDGTDAITVAGMDAQLQIDDVTVPIDFIRGDRSAAVSVNAYGIGGEAWLSTAVRTLRTASVLAQNDAAGVTINVVSGPTDLSAVVATSFETRHLLEVGLAYGFVTDGETSIACGTITATYRGERITDDPHAYTTTISLDLEA